jgi:flavin-dependent dehydrogenase
MTTDVCVAGGGPAGATVARRLALLGHRVCLVERAPFPRAHVGESLPPSIIPILDATGMRDRVEAAGFLRPDRALIRWGARGGAVRSDANQPGFQVDRDRFDALLLDAARESGVSVLQPTAVVRVAAGPGGCTALLRDRSVVRARFFVDATGRAGVLPRARRRTAPATAALYAYWTAAPLEGSETRVEAGESAWYWGAPLPAGTFNATVFVEARRCRGLTAPARDELYRDLLARSTLLASCLRGRLLGPVRVCDASPFVDEQPVTATTLKTGEAALAIDPLSSQGVQVAMAGAMKAAAVAHTIVHLPNRVDVARRFYSEGIAEASSRHATLSFEAYASAGRGGHGTFWSERTGTGDPEHLTLRRRIAGLPRRVVLSPLARLEPAPMLEGQLIQDGIALRHPRLERAVAFLGGVPIEPLLSAAARPIDSDDLVTRWARHTVPPLGWHILRWLCERGVLESAPTIVDGSAQSGRG